MTSEAKWILVQSRQYEKHMKRYLHDQNVSKALCERLKSLQDAKDPERLGDIKVGPLNGAYGTRLSKSVRLLFVVDRGAKVIRLLDMGGSQKRVSPRLAHVLLDQPLHGHHLFFPSNVFLKHRWSV